MQGPGAAAFYEERQRDAIGLIAAYQELQVHIDECLVSIGTEIESARLELAQSYLPQLDSAALARVKDLTGFLGFERRDPLKAMAHERTVLEHRVTQIKAEERFQKREEIASEHGTLQTKLIQVREQLAPWQQECLRFEQHDGFVELVHNGYDTPAFEGNWWQGSYWKHWATGDRICKELGMDDFGDDVLPAYNKAYQQKMFWVGEEQTLVRELGEVHALVQEHDNAVARLPTLENLYLGHSQHYLGEYLEQADAGLLESWVVEQGASRSVLIGLRRLAGIKAKQGFLTELKQQGLHQTVEDLRKRASKFARKTQKYLRGKHYYRQIPDRELDHKFAQKTPKLYERRDKLRKLVDRMNAYDDYEQFSLENDPALWWFEFTGKSPPRQLSNTRRWYDRQSQWTVIHDDDDDTSSSEMSSAVAVAALSRDLDEVGYLS